MNITGNVVFKSICASVCLLCKCEDSIVYNVHLIFLLVIQHQLHIDIACPVQERLPCSFSVVCENSLLVDFIALFSIFPVFYEIMISAISASTILNVIRPL